jgi:hypothetical protein
MVHARRSMQRSASLTSLPSTPGVRIDQDEVHVLGAVKLAVALVGQDVDVVRD